MERWRRRGRAHNAATMPLAASHAPHNGVPHGSGRPLCRHDMEGVHRKPCGELPRYRTRHQGGDQGNAETASSRTIVQTWQYAVREGPLPTMACRRPGRTLDHKERGHKEVDMHTASYWSATRIAGFHDQL